MRILQALGDTGGIAITLRDWALSHNCAANANKPPASSNRASRCTATAATNGPPPNAHIGQAALSGGDIERARRLAHGVTGHLAAIRRPEGDCDGHHPIRTHRARREPDGTRPSLVRRVETLISQALRPDIEGPHRNTLLRADVDGPTPIRGDA
jgi:hypothetical protein